MYGYRMASGEDDQLRLWFVFKRAIDQRAPVRVSFFKRKKDDRHRPLSDRFGNPVYVKVTRTVEPYALDRSKDGHPLVRVVDRTPEGLGSQPEYRMIRLDHIAVRYRDDTPVLTPMWSYGFLCPSPLDGEELHPTKGELNRRQKDGVLVAYN